VGLPVKKLTVKRIEDTSLWDDFVKTSPQGTVFSTSQWLNTVKSVQGGESGVVGVWKDDQLVAGVSCIHVSRGPFKKATSPVLTPYGGIIYRPDPGKRPSEAESFNMSCAEQLISYFSTRYHHVFLVHAPELKDIRPFTWAGWCEKVHYTYIMDITDIERLWDLIERKVRTVIRNAESSLELGGPVDKEHFTELYKRIYRDRGLNPPISPDMVSAMLQRIINTNLAEMRTVRDKYGQIISAMVLVYDAQCVYAWISGSIPGENASGAFSLLFWDAVKRHSGIRDRFDMVGANIPTISFFKKRFAGTLTPYYVTEKYSSPISRIIFKAYSKVKRFT
jgi:hypothetical protein